MNAEIKTNDWKLKLFGGLNKNQIRELSNGLFDNYMVFSTLKKAEIKENDTVLLTIELDNSNINLLNYDMCNNYSNRLSLSSETHDFKFKSFKFVNKKEDLHFCEPSKIMRGKLVTIEYIYIIIEASKKH